MFSGADSGYRVKVISLSGLKAVRKDDFVYLGSVKHHKDGDI